jgi:hypothetical protein
MRLVLASSALALVAACAPRAHVKPDARPATSPLAQDASGVWDWSYYSQDDQKNERFEREEWHLRQRGGHIEGYYDRVVDMRSTDDRLFRCNQKASFMKYTRVHVAGEIAGNRVQLREVGFQTKPGPCDDGLRNLVRYSGVVAGGNLALRWGPSAGQTLVKRVDHTPRQALFESTGASAQDMVTPASQGDAPRLGGVWEWQLRSIDAEGDERVEREEWHLEEGEEGIRGYYDRTVKRLRGAGSFTCNGEPAFETATRYTVIGQRHGDQILLTEIDYAAQPTSCDNAKRRLDMYRGKLSGDDALILSWGPGNQLLRRKR